jgi:hypothetical protein
MLPHRGNVGPENIAKIVYVSEIILGAAGRRNEVSRDQPRSAGAIPSRLRISALIALSIAAAIS